MHSMKRASTELLQTMQEDILKALEEVLKTEKTGLPVRVKPEIPPPPDFTSEYDKMLLQWEKEIERFYEYLKGLMDRGEILFSQLVQGLPWREIVKTFLILIFMASAGLVELHQEEEFSDIRLVLREKVVEGRESIGK